MVQQSDEAMQKDISQKIKALVAENKLEEALDLLIEMETGKGHQRYNTLILLKGKLEMLEEQELAGLLAFDELSREKRKIAHALLQMADDTEGNQVDISEKATTGKAGAPWVKYLLVAVLGIGALAVALNVLSPSENEQPIKPQQEITDQKEPVKNGPREIPAEEKGGSQPGNGNQRPENPPAPVEGQGEFLLIDFPSKGTLGTVKFSFNNVALEKTNDPNQLKLSLRVNLACRTNTETCDRPNFTLKVDGKGFVPATHSRTNNSIRRDSSVTEMMAFIMNADAGHYQIKAELYGSTFIRSFKILK